jgi:hypothetical protein
VEALSSSKTPFPFQSMTWHEIYLTNTLVIESERDMIKGTERITVPKRGGGELGFSKNQH